MPSDLFAMVERIPALDDLINLHLTARRAKLPSVLERLAHHPDVTLLDNLGCRAPGYDQLSASDEEYRFKANTDLSDLLAGYIESELLPDGELAQTLTHANVARAWDQLVESNDWHVRRAGLDRVDPAIFVAFALTRFPGAPWRVDPDGLAARQTLPPWPSRIPASQQVFDVTVGQEKKAVTVSVLAWAVAQDRRDNTILFLELVGRQAHLRQAYSRLLDDKREAIHLPTVQHYDNTSPGHRVRAQREQGKGKLEIIFNDRPLPQADTIAHALLFHPSVFQPTMGEGFLILTGLDGLIDYEKFIRQLDGIITLPVLHEWAPDLWRQGVKTRAITPLVAMGCKGWWVHPDETRWHTIIQEIIGSEDRAIETIGATEERREVVEQTEEADTWEDE